MPETIILNFYEHRPTRFSPVPQRVKVAELDAGHMTVTELEKVFEIQEMLGRTYEIKRIGGYHATYTRTNDNGKSRN